MALGTNLPTWPAIVFTYFESGKLRRRHTRTATHLPTATIIAGYYVAFFDSNTFVSRQLPPTPVLTSSTVPPHATILSLSIANMFLVQCMLSILLTVVTRESRMTKYYLVAAAIGDVGHIFASYKVMGSEIFWDFGDYNDLMAGNVFLGVFLFVNRLLTLSGVFGRIGRRG